jgi:aryl-alcohol dehydrogenase-like predicted oxidoreductase
MGTLASGYLTPDEAFAYVGSLPAVKSLVVGASSREHIAETFRAIGLSQ